MMDSRSLAVNMAVKVDEKHRVYWSALELYPIAKGFLHRMGSEDPGHTNPMDC